MAKAKKIPKVQQFPCLHCQETVRDGVKLGCSGARPEFWNDIQGFTVDKKGLPLKICSGYKELTV